MIDIPCEGRKRRTKNCAHVEKETSQYCFCILRCLLATPFVVRRGSEPPTHRIFCDSPRQEEVQQIVGATGLRAHARKLETAEWLPPHQRSGDLAINI